MENGRQRPGKGDRTMSGMFDTENKFVNLLAKVGDLILLSILWCLCTMSVLFAGLGWSTVYYVALKCVRSEYGTTFKETGAFLKGNWKQELVLGGITAVYLFGAFSAISFSNSLVQGQRDLSCVCHSGQSPSDPAAADRTMAVPAVCTVYHEERCLCENGADPLNPPFWKNGACTGASCCRGVLRSQCSHSAADPAGSGLAVPFLSDRTGFFSVYQKGRSFFSKRYLEDFTGIRGCEALRFARDTI